MPSFESSESSDESKYDEVKKILCSELEIEADDFDPNERLDSMDGCSVICVFIHLESHYGINLDSYDITDDETATFDDIITSIVDAIELASS